MPLIREEVARLSNDRRSELVKKLREAIHEPSKLGPEIPVIFEIAFAGARYDVMVVWAKWKDVRPDERADIVNEAYSDRSVEIAQAMGVTYDEAMRDHLLPYEVQAPAKEGEADLAQVRQAMLEQGAFSRGEEKFELRFPTSGMAKAAYEQLKTKMPTVHWAIVVDNAAALESYYS